MSPAFMESYTIGKKPIGGNNVTRMVHEGRFPCMDPFAIVQKGAVLDASRHKEILYKL